MRRFKLNAGIHLMEESDDGYWVRYIDLELIVKAIASGTTDDYGDLIIPVEKVKILLDFAQVKHL
jgi:hypothetical protein